MKHVLFSKIVRSPLFSLFIWWYVIGAYYIVFFSPFESSSEIRRFMLFLVLLVPILLILIQFLYNRQHPKDPITFIRGFLPWEFHEVDEGQKWITYNACRNVYIYYSIALPISIVLYALLRNIDNIPLLLIGLLGTGQYLVYWLTMRKLNGL